ncbi:hypothetical protein DM02DRAFT_725695 [Periconia macrospinosa]|uniref:Mid2 domain-containing protein n=1 Tax=Periconia macrospinosa TaxID=97972 RepID=A0A2V1E4E2_9PLEO|nr:hypothetical protein DM02DRAFT_725695 [Periconia macrospinosa]
MRVCAYLGYALFASFSFARLLTPTPAVSDPTITPAPEVPMELFRKQNDNRFVGWVSLFGSWTARTCNIGYTYYQAGSVWRCCSTAYPGCNVPVACVSGSLIFRISTSGTQTSTLTTIGCTSGVTDPVDLSYSACNTGLLYESAEAAGTDARTNIFCGPSSLILSYYRVRPGSTTTTTPSSTTTSTSTPTTTTTITPTTTPTSPPTPPPDPENKSQAWIAGAVVGPVAGIALIGAILFFFFRRKKKTPTPSPMQQHSQPNADGTAFYETQQKPNMVPIGVGTHGSTSPHQQQQWQHLPQQGQQMYPPPPPSSTASPPPQHQQPLFNGQGYGRQPGAEERPFSAELDGAQGMGGGVAPHPSPGQNR